MENNLFEEEHKPERKKFRKTKIRRYWPEGFSPVTRVVPNKKVYQRKKLTQRDIEEEYDE